MAFDGWWLQLLILTVCLDFAYFPICLHSLKKIRHPKNSNILYSQLALEMSPFLEIVRNGERIKVGIGLMHTRIKKVGFRVLIFKNLVIANKTIHMHFEFLFISNLIRTV